MTSSASTLERTRYLIEYFAAHPCIDCGETDPIVLEFDHLRDKRFDIGAALAYRNWQSILDEIEKCEVVCANCHRRRTARRRGTLRAILTQVDPDRGRMRRSARPASNRRPRAWKARALPTELRARRCGQILVGPLSPALYIAHMALEDELAKLTRRRGGPGEPRGQSAASAFGDRRDRHRPARDHPRARSRSSSLARTGPNEVGVVYNGGPLDKKTQRQLIAPASGLTWTGWLSQDPRLYPSEGSPRRYIITSTPGRR